MAVQPKTLLTDDEYMTLERESEEKHEYTVRSDSPSISCLLVNYVGKGSGDRYAYQA